MPGKAPAWRRREGAFDEVSPKYAINFDLIRRLLYNKQQPIHEKIFIEDLWLGNEFVAQFASTRFIYIAVKPQSIIHF